MLFMDTIIDNHDCHWRKKADELNQCLEELKKRVEQLERMLFGKRSEKMPSVKKELKVPANPERTQATRAERRAERAQLSEVRLEYHVEDKDRVCPECGSRSLKKVGEGKISTLIR
jgi:transposase